MTTNTNAAQVANNLIAVAEDQAFEAWYKQDCLVGGVNARIAARAAWNARAALTTAAAVPPEGFVMVPVELAERVQESLGEFLMDHGWSQRDMDTSDDFGAVLLAAAPKAEPVQAGEYPPMPQTAIDAMLDYIYEHGTSAEGVKERIESMLRAYVDADRAMRAQAAPAAVEGMSEAVAYLDIGGGGYLDLGSDLSDEALRKLPKGRHMLAIVGTYGVDGYVPVAAPTTQAAPAVAAADVLEQIANEPPINGNNLAAVRVMLAAQMLRDQITEAAAAPQPVVQQGADFAELQRLADCCPELNERNYDQDDVEELNAWAIEVAQCIDRALAAHPAAPVAQGDAEDAARYRWIAAHCRSTSEHWGGRWSIIVDGPAPKSHDSEDDFDAAIDAARSQAKEGANHD